MAQKIFRQFFNTFKGVHERFTHLTRPLEYASKCQNLVLDTSNNLVTRMGFRRFVPGATDINGYYFLDSTTLEQPKYGLHTHRYQALDGSGQIEEVIGIGNQVCRLKSATFNATYTTGTTGQLSWYVNELNAVVLEIVDDGGTATTTLTPDIDDLSIPLGLVKDVIESRPNWSVTISGYAKVNGLQTARDFTNTITVDAGHTISVATDKATMMAYRSTNGAPDLGYDFVNVTATTATTLKVKPKSAFAVIDLADNSYLGTGLVDAMSLPFFRSANCRASGGYTVTFYYWERVPWGSDRSSDFDSLNQPANWLLSPQKTSLSTGSSASFDIRYFPGSPFFQNYKMVSYDNCVYFAAQGSLGEAKKYPSMSYVDNRKSGLVQYDGQSWHQAAMPYCPISLSLNGAGVLVGTYKYIGRFKFIDYQGNEHYGADTIQTRGSPRSIVAASNTIRVTTANLTSIGDSLIHSYRINYIHATGGGTYAAGAASIIVDGGTADRRRKGLYVGDTAAIYDRTNNRIVRAKVTGITYVGPTYQLNMTLPANVTVNAGDYITNDFVVELFRTEANNNQFYYLAEIPFEYNGTNSYDDNVASVSANAVYDGPFLGSARRDPPPPLSTIEIHQGLLVGAGDPNYGNSVYWCNSDDPWAWSAATNQITVVPPESGSITALASSDDNTLAVFGDNGVSFIAGDFASASLSEISRYAGDCGCPSRHGAIKIKDELWWLSRVGLRSAKGSILQPSLDNFIKTISGKSYQLVFNQLISSADQLKPVVSKCVGYNVSNQQFALWVVPALKNISADEKVIAPSDSSVTLYFDYQNGFFGTWNHEDPYIYGAGGLASLQNSVLQLGQYFDDLTPSVRGVLFKQLGEYGASPTRPQDNFFDDYIVWIDNDLILAYDTTEDPSVDKQFLRFKIYSEPTDPSLFYAWTARVSTNRNFVLTGGTQNAQMTFSSATQYEQVIKLFSEKARAMQFRIYSENNINRFILTGIEYEVALAYKKEEVQKT